MPAEYILVREYQYDAARCVRALRALLDSASNTSSPTQEDGHAHPATDTRGHFSPSPQKSPAPRSVASRRPRVKVTHDDP